LTPKSILVACILCAALGVAAGCDRGSDDGTDPSFVGGGENAERVRDPYDQENAQTIGNGLGNAVDKVGDSVSTFANWADGEFQSLSETVVVAWVVMLTLTVLGLASMLYGWTAIKSFLVPFAPVWGLALGALTMWAMIRSFYSDTQHTLAWKLALMGGGSLFGVSLFLFAAVKAKPVATFLVIMAPFLAASVFLFDPDTQQGMQLGIAVFAVGFVAGFAAMIEVRPISILSTSFMGTLCLLSTYGILGHVLSGAKFLNVSFRWLLSEPLMLLLAMAVVTYLGCNFQSSTGPRGSLED
jgi:hypothetical protein